MAAYSTVCNKNPKKFRMRQEFIESTGPLNLFPLIFQKRTSAKVTVLSLSAEQG